MYTSNLFYTFQVVASYNLGITVSGGTFEPQNLPEKL